MSTDMEISPQARPVTPVSMHRTRSSRPPSTEPAYDEARERQHLRGRTPPPQAAAASTLSEAPLSGGAGSVVTSSTNIRKDTFQRLGIRPQTLLHELQHLSGAQMALVATDTDDDECSLQMSGTAEQTQLCELLLMLRLTPREDTARLETLRASLERFAARYTEAQVAVPAEHVGRIIGRNGQTIRHLQHQSGAVIDLVKDTRPGDAHQLVMVRGHPQSVEVGKTLLAQHLLPREDAAPPRQPHVPFDAFAVVVRVPDEHVGRVIGKSGAHIREIQQTSGARVFLPKDCLPGTNYREMLVSGTRQQINACQEMVQDKMRAPGQPLMQLHVTSLPRRGGQAAAMPQPVQYAMVPQPQMYFPVMASNMYGTEMQSYGMPIMAAMSQPGMTPIPQAFSSMQDLSTIVVTEDQTNHLLQTGNLNRARVQSAATIEISTPHPDASGVLLRTLVLKGDPNQVAMCNHLLREFLFA